MNTSILELNSTLNRSNDSQIVNQTLNWIDNTFRVILFISHIIYFLFVFLYKEFRNISYYQIHHSNLIGLITSIHYCLWINRTEIIKRDQPLEALLCTMAEISWILFRQARAYSILVLAIYRYIAVYHLGVFKRIIESYKYSLISSSSVWIISSVIFLIGKYSTNVTAGPFLCFDGYSNILYESYIYYAFTSFFGLFLPLIIILVIYILITIKLSHISNRVRYENNHAHHNFNNNGTGNLAKSTLRNEIHHRKENKLAKQLIIMNLLELSSSFFLILLSVSNLIPDFNYKYYNLRQICRILNNLAQSLIPLVSIIFNPISLNFKKTIFFQK